MLLLLSLSLLLLPSPPLSERRRYCVARRYTVCVSAEPRLHAALVSAAKVMRCIQCSLIVVVVFFSVIIINKGRQIGLLLRHSMNTFIRQRQTAQAKKLNTVVIAIVIKDTAHKITIIL